MIKVNNKGIFATNSNMDEKIRVCGKYAISYSGVLKIFQKFINPAKENVVIISSAPSFH